MNACSRIAGLGAAALTLLSALGAMTVGLSAQPTQPIYLQYDGYVKNTDGTLTLSFGYFNMNNVDVTVPPGDANGFTPGPGDRNQPVTFLKGRHRFACAMVMDKGFDGKLQWTVKHAGKTEVSTPKMLDPLYELELNSEKRAIAGLDLATAPKNVCVNRAPNVQVINPFPDVNAGAGAAGLSVTSFTARLDQEVTLNGQVEDDGLPRGSRVTSTWKKMSGPGDATFSDTTTAPTKVKFSAPGAYVLELSATDGEKTNALKVNVTVNAPNTTAGKAPDSYVKAMKDLQAAQTAVRTHAGARDYDATAADAATLRTLFGAAGAFWQPRNAADAMGFVNTGLKAADDLAAAAKSSNDQGIVAAWRALGTTCTGCHDAHRDRQADGTFTVK